MSKEENALESSLVAVRIRELQDEPIQGNYDVAHLKETHRYIFQDLPRIGLWNYDVQPGEFRTPTESWCKDRALYSLRGENGKPPDVSFTAYSRMDKEAIQKLNAVLQSANPENFKGLEKKEFTEKISALYSDLDYLHPFREGNSRTLRTFTEQLSREAGYKLNWKKFDGQEWRDLLYIARDRGLAERAAKDKGQPSTLVVDAVYDAQRHRSFPGLAELLEKTVEKTQGSAEFRAESR